MANRDEAIIPGRGFVFTANAGTEAPDLNQFDPENPEACFASWTWLGLTSKDNLVALSAEGGDSEVRDTWEYAAVRVEKARTTYGMSVNALNVNEATLGLAFPGGKWDSQKKSYAISSNSGTTDKAVFVVIIDNKNGLAALYFPNGAMSLGEAPSLSADGFLEINLKVTAQTDSKTGETFRWFTPRPKAGIGG